MSAKRNRAGALIQALVEKDPILFQSYRCAWQSEEGEIEHTRVIFYGFPDSKKLVHYLNGSVGGVLRAKEAVGETAHTRSKGNEISVKFTNPEQAAKAIELINGRVLDFSSGKARAIPVERKGHFGDFDFTKPRNRVWSVPDDEYTIMYIIGENRNQFDAMDNQGRPQIRPPGNIYVAFRQRSAGNPGNKNRDFWTIAAWNADGSVFGPESQSFPDTAAVKQWLEFKAGKERKFNRYKKESMLYDLFVPGLVELKNSKGPDGSNLVPKSIAPADTERFTRALPERNADRSSLAGWAERPGQYSDKKKGTINDQLAAELGAIKNGFLPEDTRHVGMIHAGKVSITRYSLGKSEPERGLDPKFEVAALPKVLRDRQIDDMIKKEQQLPAPPKPLPSSTDPQKEEAATKTWQTEKNEAPANWHHAPPPSNNKGKKNKIGFETIPL